VDHRCAREEPRFSLATRGDGHQQFVGKLAAEMMRRDAADARDTGNGLIMLGHEHPLAQYRAIGEMARGWAHARLGKVEPGLGELRAGINAYGTLATAVLGFYVAS
jgi:hypothetical protein